MSLTSKEIRQILLLSLAVVIIPLMLFPKKLGFELSAFSFVSLSLEVVFYGAVVYFYNRQTSLLRLIGAGLVCLVSRFVFSLFIVALYSINFGIAMQFGLFSYVPAVLFQIITMPFVLYPLMIELVGESQPVRRHQIHSETFTESTTPPPSVTSGSFVFTKEKPASKQRINPEHYRKPSGSAAPVAGASEVVSGFDKAVRYIGEDGSVVMAAVVDHEGLLLGGFKRCEQALEDLSPFSLLINDTNYRLMNRVGLAQPERTEFIFEDKKLVITHDAFFSLMVISERTVDDVLNIRISQGLDIIRNYIAERYSAKLIGNAEKQYV